MTELERVISFRRRLIDYVNYVRPYVGRPPAPLSQDAREQIEHEKAALTQEYGALSGVINRHRGVMAMRTRASGTISEDVVLDSINRVGQSYWGDAVSFADQHLNVAIGELRREEAATAAGAALQGVRPPASPAHLASRFRRLLQWLVGTARGRATAVIGTLLLVVIGAIVNGWATAFFTRLMNGQ